LKEIRNKKENDRRNEKRKRIDGRHEIAGRN
jgi:hypothetical protein